MRIVIAPDSFKECLSATRMAFANSEGIKVHNYQATHGQEVTNKGWLK